MAKKKTIQGLDKRNQFIAYAMVDKNFMMFDESLPKEDSVEDVNELQFVSQIPEFFTRLDEISFGCDMFVDSDIIKANGWKSIKGKLNRIFCETTDEIAYVSSKMEQSDKKYCKFYLLSDVENRLAAHEAIRDTPLILVGGRRLLERASDYIDVVELTVSETDSVTFFKPHQFPLERFKDHLKHKEEWKSDIAQTHDNVKQYKTFDKRDVEILENGMQLIKEKARPVNNLMSQSPYKFVRFK